MEMRRGYVCLRRVSALGVAAFYWRLFFFVFVWLSRGCLDETQRHSIEQLAPFGSSTTVAARVFISVNWMQRMSQCRVVYRVEQFE